MNKQISRADRLSLCLTLKDLCEQFGVREVKHALKDVADAIREDTGELSQEELKAD